MLQTWMGARSRCIHHNTQHIPASAGWCRSLSISMSAAAHCLACRAPTMSAAWSNHRGISTHSPLTLLPSAEQSTQQHQQQQQKHVSSQNATSAITGTACSSSGSTFVGFWMLYHWLAHPATSTCRAKLVLSTPPRCCCCTAVIPRLI